MGYLINQSSQSCFASAFWRSLLSLSLFVTLSSLGKADGIMDFAAPTYVNVPAYCKKVVRFNTKSGFDGFASLHWELDHGDPISLPDGTSEQYGHKALVSVFGPDLAALAGKPKGTIAFKAPSFIKYGDVTSGQYENDLASGDMNGDGFLDLVLLNSASQWIAIFFNDGNGNFPPTPSMEVNVSSSWDPLWLPEIPDHPFQLAIGDFDGNGKQDFAVSYVNIDRSWGGAWDFIVLGFFQKGGSFDPDYIWGNRIGYASLGCLDYLHDSPFYTIGTKTPQPKGSIFQMVAARQPGDSSDSLFFRLTGYQIYVKNYLKPGYLTDGDISEQLPVPRDPKVMFGPFTVAQMEIGLSNLDVITGAGKNIILNPGTPGVSTFVDPKLDIPGGIIAADFNLDGYTDLARLNGDDPDANVAGTELMIAYGDGLGNNPFTTGGRKIITGLPVPSRWWGNPAVMIAGNFTGDSDLMTKEPFQSIMVLGSDVVVIYPNVGNGLEQINKPMLEQLISGPESGGYDTVKITGKYWLGTPSEINSLVLTADVGGKVTVVPRANLTITPGMPDTLEFTLPAGLAPGDYTVVVKNVRWPSNELKLKIVVKPTLDNILTGPEAKNNDVVLISGNFLLGTPSEITELVLTPTMGMATSIPRASLMITAGMPDTLEFTVPGGLALGEYTVTAKNMTATSNGLKLKIVP